MSTLILFEKVKTVPLVVQSKGSTIGSKLCSYLTGKIMMRLLYLLPCKSECHWYNTRILIEGFESDLLSKRDLLRSVIRCHYFSFHYLTDNANKSHLMLETSNGILQKFPNRSYVNSKVE